MVGFLVWLVWVSLPYSAPLRFRGEPSLLLPHGPRKEDIPVDKRVFLSRGWGPGGYEVPSQGLGNAQEIVRLARLLRKEGNILRGPSIAALIAATPRTSSPTDRPWNTYPKSLRQKQTQEPLEYRRFHSIFTSGTWSPLGKRNGVSRPLLGTDDDLNDDFPLNGKGNLSEELSSPPNSELNFLPLFSIP